MDVKVSSITGLLKALSWNKILQVFALILVLAFAWGSWENRATIYNSLRVTVRVESQSPLVLNLSNGSIFAIDDTANKMKYLIGGIQVVNVDFKKNTRSTAYFGFSDINLKTSFANFQASRISEIPLFTDNETSNQRIIDLINGEFICNDFKDTQDVKLFPHAGDSISTVCAISIPPYYGRFSGYMNLYLLKKPTVDEISIIRQISRDISLKIYEKDVDTSAKNSLEK
jgi:hypothetical protein